MNVKFFGDTSKPVIVLLHGGGLSWWSWKPVIRLLKNDYAVVVPILPGHGESYDDLFVSIEDVAEQVIDYVKINCKGKVYGIVGLSIGAQILCEILAKEESICEKAVIESALIKPIKGVRTWAVPTYKLMYPLTKKYWFAKMQGKAMSLSDDMIEQYFIDSSKMSKQTLINMTISNGTYRLKSSLKNTKASVVIIVGEKEIKVMRESAKTLNQSISNSVLHEAHGLKHGEVSLHHPQVILDYLSSTN